MIIRKTGHVTGNFYMLGTNHFPTHLLDGPRPALFEAGLACLGPAYVKAIREILGRAEPCYLFLTHVHFDHCGAAAFMKRSFESLQICASQKGQAIMERPNAVKTMAWLSSEALRWIEKEAPGAARDVPFEPFEVDCILADGDRVDLGGGLTVEVVAAPGHTWDALSYYVPEKKLLVAGEAGGIVDPTGYVFTEFLVDYDAYRNTLERLAALEVEILSQSHHQIFTGEDARSFFPRAIEAAREFKSRVEELLDLENGDVKKVVLLMKAEEYDPKPDPKQPEPAYLINLTARVRHLAEKAGR